MTTRKWQNLLMGAEEAAQTVVFSGGACNVITGSGTKARNPGRDGLNTWLDEQGIAFFDPQIHPDTHGRGYDYDVDGPAEQAARSAARVTLYEVAPDTLGGVTALEVLRDAMAGKTVVIWFSGDESCFDAKGRPVFKPQIDLTTVQGLAATHLGEYVSGGTKMRANLLAFVRDLSNVTICRTEAEVRSAIEKSKS